MLDSSTDEIRFLAYDEIEALPEPQWLVDGVIQMRSSALIFGKSNAFKSFIGVDIGCSVATIGADYHGAAVMHGKTVFVVTEGANGFGRLRIPGWFDHHDVEHIDRFNVHMHPKEISLDRKSDVDGLIKAMNITGFCALLVLDIFGGTMDGSEIEDKTARTWVRAIQRIIRETGASVLTIAHTPWSDDSRARMHTHFWGSFDSRLRVEGDKEKLTTILEVERHKDADSSGQWGFRMESTSGTLVPVLDSAVKPSKARGLSVKQKIALQALDDALEAHGASRTGPDWPPCKVVRLDHWRASCDRHSLSDSDDTESRKRAFRRARGDLTERKVIRIFDDHVWRCFDD